MGKLEGVNEPQGEGRQSERKREGGRFENFAVGRGPRKRKEK